MSQVINLYFVFLQHVKHTVKNGANFSSSIKGYRDYLSQTIRYIPTLNKILGNLCLEFPNLSEAEIVIFRIFL